MESSAWNFHRLSPFSTSPIKWRHWTPLLYSSVHRRLQWIQTIGVVLALLSLSSCPEFRSLVAQASPSSTWGFFGSMTVSTLFMLVVMGRKNSPANYTSLILIWILLFYSPFEMTSMTWNNWVPSNDTEFFMVGGGIMISVFIATRSKVHVGETGIGILVGNTLGTIVSACVLFLSVATGVQARSRDLTSTQGHFRVVMLWECITASLVFCNTTFFLRTLLVTFKEQNNRATLLVQKTLLETLIWAMTVIIVRPFALGMKP